MYKVIYNYLGTLRMPYLCLLLVLLLLADILIPDTLPFIDEVILAALVLLVSRIKKPGS